MNTQRVQNCTQATVICAINDAIDSVITLLRGWQARVRVDRERDLAYREFQKLDAKALRDVGMDDPQKQLQVLGRYL